MRPEDANPIPLPNEENDYDDYDWTDYYNDRYDRDEWDDYWDDAARSVGAVPFL